MSTDTPRRPDDEPDEPQEAVEASDPGAAAESAVDNSEVDGAVVADEPADRADPAGTPAVDDVTADEDLDEEAPPAVDTSDDRATDGPGEVDADDVDVDDEPADDADPEPDLEEASDLPTDEAPAVGVDETSGAASGETSAADPGVHDGPATANQETDDQNTDDQDTARPDETPNDAASAASAVAPAGAAASGSGWRRLGATLRPRAARSQILAGVLCAALGFALVVQVQQSASDQLSSARQEDLVRLLDEVTNRAEQLAAEVSGLEDTRDDLLSGSGQAQSALELARQRAESEGILSGRLPAEGPGVEIRITDSGGVLEAAQLFNVLEELRNAGAEVVELNGVRLVTSTWFRDEDGKIVVDDEPLESPYEWTVIGDPQTMDRALEIPGGALATVRTAGAEASTTARDRVEITAVREPSEPQFATPQEPSE